MRIGAISCALALLHVVPVVAGEPISEEQLLELVRDGVDTQLIVRLVERDCVGFEVDARSVLRLSDVVPSQVLHAALNCTEEGSAAVPAVTAPSTGSATSERAESPAVPVPAPSPERASVPAPQPSGDEVGASTMPVESPELPAEVTAEASPVPSASAAASVLDEVAGDPLAADELRTLAIVPVRTGGSTNQELTTAIQDALLERGTRLALVENETLAAHFEADRPLNSGAPRDSLLAAARAAGVDAVLITESSAYMQMGNRRIRYQSRLLETQAGEVVLRSGGDSDLPGLSWEEARQAVAGQVIARVP